jgi:hypothetical protein
MIEALRLADLLETGAIWQDQEAAAAELRRLHSELERKSDAIQRLWKERDELRTLNAELAEALREIEPILARMYGAQYRLYLQPMQIVRGALAKVEASK